MHEGSDVAAPPPNRRLQRLWWRFSAIGQTAPPSGPSRLLALLFAAQILIFAVAKLAPSSLWPPLYPSLNHPSAASLFLRNSAHTDPSSVSQRDRLSVETSSLLPARDSQEQATYLSQVPISTGFENDSLPQAAAVAGSSDVPLSKSEDRSAPIKRSEAEKDAKAVYDDRSRSSDSFNSSVKSSFADTSSSLDEKATKDLATVSVNGYATGYDARSTYDGSSSRVEGKWVPEMNSGALTEGYLAAGGEIEAVVIPGTGTDQEQPLIAEKVTESVGLGHSACELGFIFVYNLPPIFNDDIVANCSMVNPWMEVCSRLVNGGFGKSFGDRSPLGQRGSWYISDQFNSEVVFRNRILQHRCLTENAELASGFYVPFYAGLDAGRYLWTTPSAERRDQLGKQLVKWLNRQPFWRRNGGWDHFIMMGSINWDFRRSKDQDWGSGFFSHPSMKNATRLLMERNPWDEHEIAVPYPTNFHPQSEAHLKAWQDHIRSLRRSKLFSFADSSSRNAVPNDFGAIVVEQCRQTKSCRFLECSGGICGQTLKPLRLFMDSTFCLQPRGDSFARRSTFDCLLAGSIPVFFWHKTAYTQYKWHLPSDETSYSVFISRKDVRNGNQMVDALASLPQERVRAMQEEVIKLIPRIVYAASGTSLFKENDAFDVAITGVLQRFKQMRFKLDSGI